MGLIVTFSRNGADHEIRFARDGIHAWEQAIALITAQEYLQIGDLLTVSLAKPADDLPETSRASHYS